MESGGEREVGWEGGGREDGRMKSGGAREAGWEGLGREGEERRGEVRGRGS